MFLCFISKRDTELERGDQMQSLAANLPQAYPVAFLLGLHYEHCLEMAFSISSQCKSREMHNVGGITIVLLCLIVLAKQINNI